MATPAPGTTPAENPYGLEQLWAQGDLVAKSTLVILLIMSAVSWWVIITKAWDQRRLRLQAKQAERDFWTAGNLKQAIEKLKGKNNAFRAIAEDGMRSAQHHEGRLNDQVDLHEWITQSLQRALDGITNYLQGGLPILASVGSTAPFVGLFGTVWGIYHALINIGISGDPSIDKVAGPVGEALIMTAIGLLVAVPAVMGYNILLRRNKVVIEKLKYFATDMHAYLLSGSRISAPATEKVAAKPAAPAASAPRPAAPRS
jgi:biopolymer transport protein ExbB